MVERWPRWSTLGDVRHILMPSGFRHGDGWCDIRSRLCEDLEPLVKEFERATDCKFEILQVKGNFGGLRIPVNHARMMRSASPSKPPNMSPFAPAKFAVSVASAGKGGWIKILCD